MHPIEEIVLPNTSVTIRRSAFAALAAAALGLAACSSDSSGSGALGGSSTSTTPAATGSGSTSGAPSDGTTSVPASGAATTPGGSSTPGASSGGSSSAATGKGTSGECADLKQISAVNNQFSQIGNDLTKGRAAVKVLGSVANKLARDASSAIRSDAKNYASAVAVLTVYVDKAKDVAQLNSLSQTDPKLKASLTSLASSSAALATYQQKSC